MNARHQIAIVGGGVVGAAAALALVREGFDVVLLERGAPPAAFDPKNYDLRVYAIAPGSVRFFERIGAWRRVAAQRVSAYERMEVWEERREQSLTFDAAELGVAQLGCIVEDSLLRSVLWSALDAAATLRTGVQVLGFAADEHGARLQLAGGETVEADLVIGAEGAESRLREWAGIEPVGWAYPQRSLVCHVATEKPHRRTAWQRFLPNGPLAFLPLADGRCSIVWSTEASEADELLALKDGAFRERLGAAFEHELGAITAATPRLAFPLRLLHAPEYVRPGLALIGDSAHVIHPLAGQGMNLGLADAQALVETLVAARPERRPLGNLRLLKRYERRRKAENVEAMALTDGLYRLFKARTPGLQALRGLGLALVERAGPLKRELAQRAMGIR